jgi:hypothetical protein
MNAAERRNEMTAKYDPLMDYYDDDYYYDDDSGGEICDSCGLHVEDCGCDDCGLNVLTGQCCKAGTEECDWDCPHSRGARFAGSEAWHKAHNDGAPIDGCECRECVQLRKGATR